MGSWVGSEQGYLRQSTSKSSPRVLTTLIAKELERIREERRSSQIQAQASSPTQVRDPLPPFADWVKKASPRYERPTHLEPLCALIDRVRAGEVVRAVVHAPPRHWKTETVLHAPAYLMQDKPNFITAYVTYDAALADSKSHIARSIALENGIILERSRLEGWVNKDRGGFIATSIGGPFTGQGANLVFVDDYFKDRASAESKHNRDKQWEWWSSVALLRLEPNASIIVLGTRWHVDDLGGRLIDLGWDYIRLPAVDDPDAYEHFDKPELVAQMKALLPHKWPASSFAKKKKDGMREYDWIALYGGLPIHAGGNVFGSPATYRDVPNYGVTAIGIDCAYSEKTKADWNSAVVMKKVERIVEAKTVKDEDGRTVFDFFVLETLRKQCKPEEFKLHLSALHERYPRARIGFRGAAPEAGTAALFRQSNALGTCLPVEFKATNISKFTRALKYAAAWNSGRVLVPEDPEKQGNFVTEHCDFTGTSGDTDDQVDAGSTVFDMLDSPAPSFGNSPVLQKWGRGR
jgi:predicted phage terminase large subunit-like protein